MTGDTRLVRLVPRALEPLPVGSIRPAGWLLSQLRIQADGLSGHLDEFWPDVAESGWIGGGAEAWERGPYWLDGAVPLAFLLDDAGLKEKVARWVEHILTHRHEDGWLGPVDAEGYQPYDPWPVTIALKALTQYESATGDPRIVPAAGRALHRIGEVLAERPLWDWGRFRWADLVLSAHWLYERTQEGWLLDLAEMLRRQGYDWRAHFADFRWKGKTSREECSYEAHVVNNAMAVKQPGVWYRQSADEGDRDAVHQIIATLDEHHGQATGVFTGDEHYAGKSPSQGTELCAVVEYMFSLETLVSILGSVALADRLERIAFNALPATFKPDMWAHQYDQQANQVICRVSEDRVYTSNGPDANIFGLAPNYGCCLANMHQGWPKLATHLWMRAPDGGLAAVAYAPCDVMTDVGGTPVRLSVETGYPFDDTVHIRVEAPSVVRFPLQVRIPAWAEGAEVEVHGEGPVSARPGTLHRVAREVGGGDVVRVKLPMRLRAARRYHNSISLERGPLAYALRIGEDWRPIGGEPPHGDWEVHPTTPWNYALQIDETRPESSIRIESRSVGGCPFSPEGAPIVARVKGRRLPDWGIEHNAAAPPPASPVRSSEPLEELELVPYGCTNLRVTEFPTLA